MGPYCKFCGTRCFALLPAETPKEIMDAYGTSTIVATCPAGQVFEKTKVGYCYDDIQKAIAAAKETTEWLEKQIEEAPKFELHKRITPGGDCAVCGMPMRSAQKEKS